MTKKVNQRECCIRGRKEIRVSRYKTVTVTRLGEWGGKHSVIIEERTYTSVKIERFEYPESQKCIKAFEQKIRDIKKEYRNVNSY